MKNLYRLIFLLLFLGLIPFSCEKCDSSSCECEDFSDVKDFEILDMEAAILYHGEGNFDPLKYYPQDSLVIFISTSDRRSVALNDQNSSFPFSSSLWACSPVEPRPVNPIVSLSLISQSELAYSSASDSISVGEEITDRFLYGSGYFYDCDNLFNGSPWPYDYLEMKLASAPSEPLEIVVDIHIDLEDGKQISIHGVELRVRPN